MEKILEEVSRVDLSMCSAGLVYLASSAAAYLPDAFSLAVQYGLGIRSVYVSLIYIFFFYRNPVHSARMSGSCSVVPNGSDFPAGPESPQVM